MSEQRMPLVEFKNLTIELTKGESKSTLVKDLSLEIFPREVVGLVGESGSGKSITALSILKLLPMPPMGYPKGDITFNNLSILTAKENEIRRLRGGDIGCIFQEPMTSLNPLHTIEKQLAESLYLHRGYSRERARSVSLEWLARVELKEPVKKLQAYPHQLSGGERQRVMIAMALINEPKLLIADEPTTALDVTVQAQILELIQKLQRDLNMSVLFISHDLGVVKQLSDRIAVMQAGQLVEVDAADKILNEPQHPYTRQLIDAEPSGTPVPVKQTEQRLISAKDTRVWFPVKRGVMRKTVGHIKAVDGVSFELIAGQTLGIVGESGSGKSTLAKALLGLENSEGALSFVDHELDGTNLKQWQPLRTRMQVVFQDPYGSLSPRMSVLQIISEGLEVNKIGTPAEREQRVMDIMQRVGLDPEMRHRYPNEFSGGQRQRIAIARAMIMEPELVVLDEPTSSLDRTVQFQILELLREFQQEKGTSFIFISHDLKVVKALAHYVLVMKDGKVVEQGKDIFTQPQESYTRSLIETAFQI